MKQIVYKVVREYDGRYFSVSPVLFGDMRVEYFVDRVTVPNIPNTPLLVFGSLNGAVHFLTSMSGDVILEGVGDVLDVAPSRLISDLDFCVLASRYDGLSIFQDFWSAALNEKFSDRSRRFKRGDTRVSLMGVPAGTLFVSSFEGKRVVDIPDWRFDDE